MIEYFNTNCDYNFLHIYYTIKIRIGQFINGRDEDLFKIMNCNGIDMEKYIRDFLIYFSFRHSVLQNYDY